MSERVRIWGLRLLAISLALVLWFFISFERREIPAERELEVPVTYSLPRDLVRLDQINTVHVKLRGDASVVRTLTPFMVDVLVQLPDAEAGSQVVELAETHLSMPTGLTLIAFDPPQLVLELDREVSRLLPVEAQLVGEPAAGAIWETPRVSPDRVLVRGPESLVQELNFLLTSPVTLDGHALTFDEVTTVQSPTALVRIIQPVVVTVRVPMKQPGMPLEEETE